jgi:hypothetical protein
LKNKHSTATNGRYSNLLDLLWLRDGASGRESFRATQRPRAAIRADRAVRASGRSRRANDGAQFHDGLIPIAGAVSFQEIVGELSDSLCRARSVERE